MRIYKLQLHLCLVDGGEIADAQEDEQPQQEMRNKMLIDPLDRQEKMVDKLTAMASLAAQFQTGPRTTGNTIHMEENYDVPAEALTDALHVLQRFHDLANTLGTPASAEPAGPSPFPRYLK